MPLVVRGIREARFEAVVRPLDSTLPAGLGARYDDRDDGRDPDFTTADGIASEMKNV